MSFFRQLLGYGVASACAWVVDASLLWAMVDHYSINYLLAAGVSFTAGAVLAYLISIKLAFDRHRLKSRGAEFLSFVALGTVGLGMTTLVMGITVRLIGLHYLVGKCIATGCTFACNFLLRRQILFTTSTPT